jgi:anti-sigma-K factor RskA
MSQDDPTILAGEYVLGLLTEAQAAALLQKAATDPALAQAIVYWQARLDPLADTLAPVPPSNRLWARIAADTDRPAAVAETLSPSAANDAWRPLAIASLLLAACLAAFIGWSQFLAPRNAPAPTFRAEALLTAPGSVLASIRVQILRSGEIVVVPLQKLDIDPAQQMDLWAWPREAKAPVLLGAVAADGGTRPFPYPARDGTPVMITRETAGAGAPAAPGPTLYAGLLVASR